MYYLAVEQDQQCGVDADHDHTDPEQPALQQPFGQRDVRVRVDGNPRAAIPASVLGHRGHGDKATQAAVGSPCCDGARLLSPWVEKGFDHGVELARPAGMQVMAAVHGDVLTAGHSTGEFSEPVLAEMAG